MSKTSRTKITVDRYVVETLMRELVGEARQPSAFLVYLCLSARTAEQRTRKVAASYQQLADETGLSRSATQAAVGLLVERRLLRVERPSKTATPSYVVERPWLTKR